MKKKKQEKIGCNICGKTFSSAHGLRIHRGRAHPHPRPASGPYQTNQTPKTQGS